jgi:hypothetical protein
MCDVATLGLISTVVGTAGSAMNAFGAMNAQKKQKQAVDQWAQRQDAMRAAEKGRQDTLRQQAEAAQQQGLQQTSADAQKAAQTDEAARLAQYMQGEGDPQSQTPEAAAISASDQAIAAGATSGDPQKTDLAKKINEATTSAKQRIAALANVSSYGGSEGGLGTIVPQAFARSGSGIDTANDFRRGSLAAYSTERAVDPVQVSYTGSPLAQMFSDFASLGAQGIGSAAGKSAFGTFPTAAPTKPFIGPARPIPAYLNPDYGHLF